ncbi:MAG TPA: FHA domain-containing protein [Pirellulales bacterium]|nr:FHA domain-containing protein [Pirellulales bacterium]
MFQPWRIKLRAAEEAFRSGRLEEAGEILRSAELREFLPAQRLLAKVAAEIARRADRRLTAGQTSAGCRDLAMARAWGADADRTDELRQHVVERRLQEAQTYLAAGEPAAALARLELLAGQTDVTQPVRSLREAARRVLAAQRYCRTGEFARAEQELSAALALAPAVTTLEDARNTCRVKGTECRRLVGQLHAAVCDERWTEGLTLAETILELCPDHEPARDARRRAWARAGMHVGHGAPLGTRAAPRMAFQAVDPGHDGLEGHPPWVAGAEPGHQAAGNIQPAILARRCPGEVQAGASPRLCPSHQKLKNANSQALKSPVNMNEPPHSESRRFLLWVDGVGGYLVCTGDEVLLGQPVDDSRVDIPILGDVSRRHAKIRRDGESYLIEPIRGVRLDGRPIERATTLADGCQIELGGNVRLRFHRPHPLSATARLEFVSHHRTQPSADAILLLADSCILGASGGSHVVCRDWAGQVVLFRQDDGLYCQAPGQFRVDGVAAAECGRLASKSQVVGEDFSFSVEPLDEA